jgi:plasmid stabilization system protein ParE
MASGISRWIASDNPRVALEKATMLADACELLDSFPNMGSVYLEPIRHFTKELWVIIYRPTRVGVYIHRVFDSRQDWRAQLI